MKIEPVFIADKCDRPTDSGIWHLRDAGHALTWLQVCTAWADAGQSGLPPLDPFRLWGLELEEIGRLVAPLKLLVHAMSFRQPDSAGIREQIAHHPPEQLRWALLCLRHHGSEHAKVWSAFQDERRGVDALQGFLAQQWWQQTAASLPVGPAVSEAGRLLPRLRADVSQCPPDQGLLDASLWNSLIRMQSANGRIRFGNREYSRTPDMAFNREGLDEGFSQSSGHQRAELHREGLAL